MSFEEVVYETDGHVATVTLSRPGKLNAWTLRMSQEVREAMRQAADDDADAVVLWDRRMSREYLPIGAIEFAASSTGESRGSSGRISALAEQSH